MRVLVHAGNLGKGGAVQVALSFIRGVVAHGQQHEWLCVVHPTIRRQLGTLDAAHVQVVEAPDPPLTALRALVLPRFLARQERVFAPDIGYTVLGPPYWSPSVPQICGFALVWTISPESPAWDRLGTWAAWRTRLRNRIKLRYFSRAWDYIVETETARQRFAALIGVDAGQVHVVHNGASAPFHAHGTREVLAPPAEGEVFRFLSIAADYPHKNLGILPDVAKALAARTERPFRIVLTLPEASWERIAARARTLGVEERFENAGFTPVDECPALYASCHALLMPTMMEVFSASYPEAMTIGLPIATSDLDFARDICGEGARYFDPTSPSSIAEACAQLMTSREAYDRLTRLGIERGKRYPTPQGKYELTIGALERFAASRGGGR